MLFKRLQILCEDRPDVTVELLAGELSYSIFGFFSFSLDEGFVVAEKDSGKLVFSGDEGELELKEDILKRGFATLDSATGVPIAILNLPNGYSS
jgi:hypothetical protein